MQTVFDSGTILHKVCAARATCDQASARYRGTVLVAFQNVADTVETIKADADALDAAEATEGAATSSVTSQNLRLKPGNANGARGAERGADL